MSLPSIMDGFGLDPEFLKGYTPEQIATAQARYADLLLPVTTSVSSILLLFKG